MIRRGLVVAVLVVACFAVPTVAGAAEKRSTDAAEDALEEYFERIDKRQWGRVYAMLHPAHQQLVPLNDFADCMEEDLPATVRITDFEVVETYRERRTLPGTSLRVPTVAITFELTAADGSREESATETVNAIYAKGRWRFAMSEPQLEDCGVAEGE